MPDAAGERNGCRLTVTAALFDGAVTLNKCDLPMLLRRSCARNAAYRWGRSSPLVILENVNASM
jgi:hypothetical protein